MQGNEWEGPEEAFRRGYEHAAIETFHAVRRLLEPAAREILRIWVERHLRMAAQFDARLPPDLAIENVSGRGVAEKHQRPLRPQSSSASRRTDHSPGGRCDRVRAPLRASEI